MYETYPKGSVHPSGSVGEQEVKKADVESWKGDPSQTRYPGEGYKGTDFNGHDAKCQKLDQSNRWPGNPSKTSYPKGKSPAFGTEKSAASLKQPTCTAKPC